MKKHIFFSGLSWTKRDGNIEPRPEVQRKMDEAQVTIQCPKCCVKLVVNYRTSGYGHGTTDEALAIHDAIKDHLCKPDPQGGQK